MTDHYREAEELLGQAREHTYLGDEKFASRAALFAARAQVHALLALADRLAPAKPDPEPEAVPLWRAAETWGDDIEVQSLDNPTVRWRVRGGKYLITGGNKWWTLTKASKAIVTLASREHYRDDPWTPGQIRAAGIETQP